MKRGRFVRLARKAEKHINGDLQIKGHVKLIELGEIALLLLLLHVTSKLFQFTILNLSG